MTRSGDMRQKPPGTALQGLEVPLATVAAAMGEVAPPESPQPSRELAEFPWSRLGPALIFS